MFIADDLYSKKDIYKILNVPKALQKGNWNTGYTFYENNIYIFCNIGVPGRTGHDYNNHWEGDYLIWYGKNGSKITHPSIKQILNPSSRVLIFTRTDSSSSFTYQGEGKIEDSEKSVPVKITWSFNKNDYKNFTILNEEITNPLYEGSTVKITVNKYERNLVARQQCIDHYGYLCQICGFDFNMVYGGPGKDFIHVHHLKLLSEIKKEYIVNPIEDLIPVCPNCHAMIHRKTPCYTLDEIKKLVNS